MMVAITLDIVGHCYNDDDDDDDDDNNDDGNAACRHLGKKHMSLGS